MEERFGTALTKYSSTLIHRRGRRGTQSESGLLSPLRTSATSAVEPKIDNLVNTVFSALETKCLNVLHKSKNTTLGRWYSAARVSKRPSHKSTACLRARYCTNHMCS